MSEELAKRGASVVLADRQVDLAQEVAEQIISAGRQGVRYRIGCD